LRSDTLSGSRKLALAGLLFVISLAGAVPAMAQTGGSGPPGSTTTTTTTTTTTSSGTAQIQPDGTALAPASAPRQVRKAIAAGNKIHTRPYIWGGGHRRFKSKGYDCSGAVSYVLHAAGLLRSPLSSGPLMRWGAPGIGSWITVYANSSHAWMTVAGLRFDTSAVGESLNQGSGPRWRASMRAATGYAARYYPGL
jgi:hypothetical protein